MAMPPPTTQPRSPLGLAHHRIFGRVHVVLYASEIPADDPDSPYAYFGESECSCQRLGIDRTMGPVSLLVLYNFSRKLDELIQSNPHRSTALCVIPNVEAETTAALLLGTYMVMRLDFSTEEAARRLDKLHVAPFPNSLQQTKCRRHSTPIPAGPIVESAAGSDHHSSKRELLRVKDCLEALQLAKKLRWIDLCAQDESKGDPNQPGAPSYGFDATEYEFLTNPLNADLNEASILPPEDFERTISNEALCPKNAGLCSGELMLQCIASSVCREDSNRQRDHEGWVRLPSPQGRPPQ